MSDANKAITRALMEIFNGGDASRVNELIAANGVDHQGVPGLDTNGPEGFMRAVNFYRTAFPDAKTQEVAVVAEGDLVVFHSRMTGTQQGEFMGTPPTGKSFDVLGVDILRFADGKAVEHWGYFEEAKMMEQLGMMPSS